MRKTMDNRQPATVAKCRQSIAGGLMLFMFVCLPFSSVFAEDANQLFATANNAYKDKNYDIAIGAYQKLISEGYKTTEVYYNLANSYYKTDKISLAILNYEKALKQNPADDDVRFNLKLANLKTVDRIVPVPQLSIITKWQSLMASQSSKSWALYSVSALWLALIAFALYLFVDNIRRVGFYSGSLLVVVSIFFFYLAYTQNLSENGATQAILTSSNAYIKSAPDGTSTDLYLIHEGVKLNLLDKVGNWSKVSLSDGKVGWVEQGTYTVI